jgi:hypothetical protein
VLQVAEAVGAASGVPDANMRAFAIALYNQTPDWTTDPRSGGWANKEPDQFAIQFALLSQTAWKIVPNFTTAPSTGLPTPVKIAAIGGGAYLAFTLLRKFAMKSPV